MTITLIYLADAGEQAYEYQTDNKALRILGPTCGFGADYLLYVGNLPFNVTEVELREHFSTIGPLSYLSIPTDRETGKQRGFAFVEFKDRAQADEAIRRFNNQSFQGRSLSVSEMRRRMKTTLTSV